MLKVGQIPRGSILGEMIYNIVKQDDIVTICELGTWNGLGVTTCIKDAIMDSNKKDYMVLSLEVVEERCREALENLSPLPPNFFLIHGSIVSRRTISSKENNNR